MTRLDYTIIALAGRLHAKAVADCIAVDHIVLSPERIGIYAEDRALTPALAVALGLTERSEFAMDDGVPLEFFRGQIDGVTVQTHGHIPSGGAS